MQLSKFQLQLSGKNLYLLINQSYYGGLKYDITYRTIVISQATVYKAKLFSELRKDYLFKRFVLDPK